jgi:3-methyl-2-oxobutanoate hydroxymethyltransferase
MDQMIYHSSCVTAAVQRALVVGDMPFLSYQVSKEEAVKNAGRFVKEAGVAAVKLEGGVAVQQMIEAIVACEIPVMGHVGLTPQSFNRMGGYRVQGKGAEGEQNLKSRSRTQIINDALAVQAAGAFSVVLEGVPSDLAEEITELLAIPTIGIGAGSSCSGQILVTHDMVGLTSREVPKFVKQYAQLGRDLQNAVAAYIGEVEQGTFPSKEFEYTQAESTGRLKYDVV